MSEREKSDFNRGDTNNDHFSKRGRTTSDDTEPLPKRMKTDNHTDQTITNKSIGTQIYGQLEFPHAFKKYSQTKAGKAVLIL